LMLLALRVRSVVEMVRGGYPVYYYRIYVTINHR
jgi:hypothetical protein